MAFKLVGYGGPTVILIRERRSGAVWGGCADSPWKESNSFYGGGASFLLRLAPDFKVIPSKMARCVPLKLSSPPSLSLLPVCGGGVARVPAVGDLVSVLPGLFFFSVIIYDICFDI